MKAALYLRVQEKFSHTADMSSSIWKTNWEQKKTETKLLSNYEFHENRSIEIRTSLGE
jgi:hypothetical protein